MKNSLFFIAFALFICACQTAPTTSASDAWSSFQKCSGSPCVQEALAVKEAFLKNPQQVLTAFQTTYEKGEDHVIGWLFILRDSVLINPKMGTVDERLAMQQAVIAAAKTYENDPKVQEMARNVMDYLNVVDVKAGKINEPMPTETAATTPSYCYQFNNQGEHIACQLLTAANGEFSGYHSWFIDGKDGTKGVLKGKNFNSDTLFIEHTYFQEGEVSNDELIFLKKGDNLVQLVSGVYDKNGKEVLKNRKALKAGNTLTKVDCAKLSNDLKPIQALEKDAYFTNPNPKLSPKDEKVYANLQGEWQSSDDTKAGIKIADGKFTFIYAGQKTEPSMRLIYYPICPKDCNPIAKMPCLKLIGQEGVCYSIVKADGKSLDISQIGGTGNTNRYVKKK
jgi:hypothetical protein